MPILDNDVFVVVVFTDNVNFQSSGLIHSIRLCVHMAMVCNRSFVDHSYGTKYHDKLKWTQLQKKVTQTTEDIQKNKTKYEELRWVSTKRFNERTWIALEHRFDFI